MDDDPADEDVDSEVELDVVDVVFVALVVVSSGFNAVVSDSILVRTAPVLRGRCCGDCTTISILFFVTSF